MPGIILKAEMEGVVQDIEELTEARINDDFLLGAPGNPCFVQVTDSRESQ